MVAERGCAHRGALEHDLLTRSLQMVFLIDLPKLEASVDHQPTHFSTELGRFLSETGVGAGMVSSLSNYDFSRTKHLGFVYTM